MESEERTGKDVDLVQATPIDSLHNSGAVTLPERASPERGVSPGPDRPRAVPPTAKATTSGTVPAEPEEDSGAGEIPEITVDLGHLGSRKLILDSNAMELIEARTSIRFLTGFRPSCAGDVLAFFWACLQHEANPPTEEEIGRALYIYQLGEIFEIIARLSGRVKNSPDVLAPFLVTDPKMIDAIFRKLDPQFGQVLWDLGSGDGRILAKGLRDYGLRGIGVEWNEALINSSRELVEAMDARDKIEIRAGTIQEHLNDPDLGEADYVFVFLLAHSNVRIGRKLRSRLKTGAKVISPVFEFRGWEEGAGVSVETGADETGAIFYVYTMGERAT